MAEPTAGVGVPAGGIGGDEFPPPSGAGGISGGAGFDSGAGTGVITAGAGSFGGSGTGGTTAQRMFNAGDAPDRNAVRAGTICERLATIQCAGEEFCCLNPGRDVAACKQDIRSSCDQDALVDDIAAEPVTGFDAAQAMTVFTELERLASQCDPMFAAYAESFDGLRSIFRGTVEAGGDCRPTNPLNKTQAGAALASCTDYASQACVPSLAAWTCTRHAAAGGHCFSDINCQPGLYCDNPDFAVGGADCLQRKAIGASCALDNECLSLFCRGGACVNADVQAAYCLAAAP